MCRDRNIGIVQGYYQKSTETFKKADSSKVRIIANKKICNTVRYTLEITLIFEHVKYRGFYEKGSPTYLGAQG